MAIEEIRHCGYRKVGGLYLCGSGMTIPCDRLPFPLDVCPVCGQGFKPTTGFTHINPTKLFNGKHTPCKEPYSNSCPMCNPDIAGEKSYLMWVGGRFYSPESFIQEAEERGVSKRIPFIPHDLKLGETWIYLAHKEACTIVVEDKEEKKLEVSPGIFYAFRPTKIEKLIWKSETTEKTLKALKDQNITPVVVPDGDKDHDPSRSIWLDLKQHKKEEKKI